MNSNNRRKNEIENIIKNNEIYENVSWVPDKNLETIFIDNHSDFDLAKHYDKYVFLKSGKEYESVLFGLRNIELRNRYYKKCGIESPLTIKRDPLYYYIFSKELTTSLVWIKEFWGEHLFNKVDIYTLKMFEDLYIRDISDCNELIKSVKSDGKIIVFFRWHGHELNYSKIVSEHKNCSGSGTFTLPIIPVKLFP